MKTEIIKTTLAEISAAFQQWNKEYLKAPKKFLSAITAKKKHTDAQAATLLRYIEKTKEIEPATRLPKYHIWRSKRPRKQPFWVNLIASNGQIVWTSETKCKKSSCLEAIEREHANQINPYEIIDHTGEK